MCISEAQEIAIALELESLKGTYFVCAVDTDTPNLETVKIFEFRLKANSEEDAIKAVIDKKPYLKTFKFKPNIQLRAFLNA